MTESQSHSESDTRHGECDSHSQSDSESPPPTDRVSDWVSALVSAHCYPLSWRLLVYWLSIEQLIVHFIDWVVSDSVITIGNGLSQWRECGGVRTTRLGLVTDWSPILKWMVWYNHMVYMMASLLQSR